MVVKQSYPQKIHLDSIGVDPYDQRVYSYQILFIEKQRQFMFHYTYEVQDFHHLKWEGF